MKIYKYLMLLVLTFGLFVSCSKDDDIDENPKVVDLPGEEPEEPIDNVNLEINDFIWKGMNLYYLFKSDIPQLGDNYFSSQIELNTYLKGWESPENLFYDGLKSDQDRFSWLIEDYVVHDNSFQGSNKGKGFIEGYRYAPNSDTDVWAYVKYVSPGGPADIAGLKRGDYVSTVNGVKITIDNFQNSFSGDVLDLGLSKIVEGETVSAGEINIVKAQFKEETVPVNKVFTVDGVKIGYLFLSTFLGEFGVDDVKLNDVFGDFKSQNIDELVVDLRYNRGGWSEFSADMGSMITGQFEGDIFTKQQWNQGWQDYWEQQNPERLYHRFDSKVDNGDDINSLNLNNVYVIATGSSYSASESLIIGLEAHIDVIHIGSNTGGKYQGSFTLYDGDGFGKENINPDHKYAIQPIVYKFANANGFSDFADGLIPDIEIEEGYSSLSQLGELDEPLLARAIADITGNRNYIVNKTEVQDYRKLKSKDEKGLYIENRNLIEDLPIKQSLFEK